MKLFFRYTVLLLIVGVLTQGFQCASPEMGTAEMAYNNAKTKDDESEWKKARDNYEKEVAQNPTNGDAWFRLVDVYSHFEDYEKMLNAIEKAGEYQQDPGKRQQLAAQRFNAWVGAYNNAADMYTTAAKEADKNRQKKLVGDALKKIDLAKKLKPENPDVFTMEAYLHELVKDTAAATAALESYVAGNQDGMEILMTTGITLDAVRDVAQRAWGQPSVTKGSRLGEKDSVVIDIYNNLKGHETYVFYREQDGKFVLKGIRTDLPKNWLDSEKQRFYALESSVYRVLAYNYFDARQYAIAEKYITQALHLNPRDQSIMQLQTSIIEETGNQEQALAAVKKLVDEFPENELYLGRYGSLLAGMKRYEEAVEIFERALKVKPDYELALYNIAACYKNMAGKIQNEEEAKVEADEKYERKEDRYFPMLEKAAEYFGRFRKLSGKDRDLQAIQELINVHMVLRNNAEVDKLLAEVEGLEYANKDSRSYYEFLGTIYAKRNKGDKAQKYFDKADALK